MRGLDLTFSLLKALAGFLLAAWVIMVALFSPIFPSDAQQIIAATVLLFAVGSIIHTRVRRWFRAAFLTSSAIVLVLFLRLAPSNDRQWRPDVSQVPWAEIDGDTVTVHNVRNFTYRTENDADVNYETRVYHLSEISSVDFVASYWSGKAIAHIMTSFSFNDSTPLAFSIETRKSIDQDYSTVKGFFRNYELAYVAADERDLIGLRTTYRVPPEDVYLLRSAIPAEKRTKLFLQYISDINKLKAKPRFYNTLTTNCTTQILKNAQTYSSTASYSWRILLSGYVPELLYNSGKLDQSLPLTEVLERGHVNARSREAAAREDYSQYIRVGVPDPNRSATHAKLSGEAPVEAFVQ